MKFDIRQEHGHYELYVDGVFYGSFDTATEAAQSADEIKDNKEDV